MRICHITINPIDYERRILNQAQSAIEVGYQVDIISLRLPGNEGGNTQLRPYVWPLETPFYKGGVLKFLHFNWKVFLFLIKKPLEIIHCHDLWVLPAAVVLSFFKHCNLIYDAHEFYGGLEVFTRNKIRKKIWMVFEYLAIPRVDVLITVSEQLAELYQKKYPNLKSVRVIRNLPKTEFSDEGLKTSGFPVTKDAVILFQGHFRPGRGLLNLFKAFSEIEDAHLVMIGGGELEEDLKEVVEKKNLAKRVTFMGYLPTDDLIRTTAQADLGIALFEPTSINYAYALPNKFFEYIMAGIPVLASNIKTFEDYIGTYQVGLTVDPSDISAISRKLVDMLSDGEKMRQWRSNARKASKELNWELEAKKLIQIYELNQMSRK